MYDSINIPNEVIDLNKEFIDNDSGRINKIYEMREEASQTFLYYHTILDKTNKSICTLSYFLKRINEKTFHLISV